MMKDVQSFARITSTVPTIWLISFLISLLIGILSFGHIPVYGADHDPYHINSIILNIFNWISIFSELLGLIAVPAWLFLITHLLINKVKITRKELTFHLTAIFSLIIFSLFRFVWTSQYLWVYD